MKRNESYNHSTLYRMLRNPGYGKGLMVNDGQSICFGSL